MSANASAFPGTPSGRGAVNFLFILFIAEAISVSVIGGIGEPKRVLSWVTPSSVPGNSAFRTLVRVAESSDSVNPNLTQA